VRRDTGEKEPVKLPALKKRVAELLDDIQLQLFQKAKRFLDGMIADVDSWNDFLPAIRSKKLARIKFCGEEECEDLIKEKTGGVTSRCIPLDAKKPIGKCVHCGKDAQHIAIFGRNY